MKQKIYMNRELSWLKFNERVLAEAQNLRSLCVRGCHLRQFIRATWMEFFMVRVGTLVDQLLIDRELRENKTKMTSQEQLDAIIPEVKRLNRKKDTIYEDLMEKLEHYGMKLVNFQKISKKESEYLRKYFKAEIAPLISPTIIAKRQPFPFLKNTEIYAVAVLETKNGQERLAIIPCGSGVIPAP